MYLEEKYDLWAINSMGIRAHARYFCPIKEDREILEALKKPELASLPLFVLGGGSNVLFTKDFEGLVLKMETKGISIIKESDDFALVRAKAGEQWDDFVKFSVDNGLSGAENLSLIPGTVGASPVQNIGAYGTEVKDIFFSLNGYSLPDLRKKEISFSKMDFSYRSSIMKTELRGKFIITSVTFKLNKKFIPHIEYRELKKIFADSDGSSLSAGLVRGKIIELRRKKLPDPDEIGNCGSFFKNPQVNRMTYFRLKTQFPDIVSFKVDEDSVKIPAAWMIEKCGLKGVRKGSVGTYKNQALVIVNYGGATGSEIKEFAEEIIETVYKKFKVRIQPEVNFI